MTIHFYLDDRIKISVLEAKCLELERSNFKLEEALKASIENTQTAIEMIRRLQNAS